MALPKVNLKFDNGNAGFVQGKSDGVFALVGSATAVGDTFALDTPYALKSIKDIVALGISAENNKVLFRTLKEFYEEAGEGTTLWLMGVDKTKKVSAWFELDSSGVAPVSKLLDAANGAVSMLFTKYSPKTAHNGGLDADVKKAMAKAQAFCEAYTFKKYAPVFVVLEAYGTTVKDLPDLNSNAYNRVAVFVGNTEPQQGLVANYNHANHVLAGRLAKIGVHENPGKVKLGALVATTAFIGDTPVELADVESIHDKGYITFRSHIRKAGYYISDDPMATSFDDDYHYITRRRVIDKAFKLAYDVVINELLQDFDLMPNGTVSPFYAKSIEMAIENRIYQEMTLKGELSQNVTDNNDLGVKAIVDLSENVATTNTIKINLKVRPKGYARWFEILLGYEIKNN